MVYLFFKCFLQVVKLCCTFYLLRFEFGVIFCLAFKELCCKIVQFANLFFIDLGCEIIMLFSELLYQIFGNLFIRCIQFGCKIVDFGFEVILQLDGIFSEFGSQIVKLMCPHILHGIESKLVVIDRLFT